MGLTYYIATIVFLTAGMLLNITPGVDMLYGIAGGAGGGRAGINTSKCPPFGKSKSAQGRRARADALEKRVSLSGHDYSRANGPWRGSGTGGDRGRRGEAPG
jgi:hypothetical protein